MLKSKAFNPLGALPFFCLFLTNTRLYKEKHCALGCAGGAQIKAACGANLSLILDCKVI
jgi:hypothetical protein